MLIDSHTHLNFKAFNEDRAEVIKRCEEAQMKLINIGAALATSGLAVELAKEHDNFYAAVGLHPIHVFDEDFKLEDYQKLISSAPGKVVATGESGFDYWHLDEVLAKGAKDKDDIRERQEKVFRSHIKLARDNNLALVVHGRNGKEHPDAYQDIYRVLQDEKWSRAVVHCYGGNLEEAKKFIETGFFIGITGIVTFDKTGKLEEIVKWAPLDRILIETDAPYLSPEPNRGKRNEPPYVKYVAEKISEIKHLSVDEVINITGDNATKLFNLK